MLERWHHPEFQSLVSEVNRECWRKPEYRARKIEAMRERWRKPEFRAPMLEALKVARSLIPRRKKPQARQ